MAVGKKKPEEKKPGTTNIARSLRDDAEKQFAHSMETSPHFKGQTPEKLIHELGVHQIELEMQADQLRTAQLALEESRDKYLDLYEFAPIGYLTLNDKALITEVNLNGATLLSVERSKLVSHGLGRFIAPGNHEIWDQFFIKVQQQEEKQTCTLTLKRGDGTLFPARLEGIRITGSDGTITVRIALSDITDIWQIEALRESEKEFRQLFESASDAVFVIAMDTTRIIDANSMASTLYGYDHDELLTMKSTELSSEPEATQPAAHEAQKEPGLVMTIPLRLHRKRDGTVFPVEITARNIARGKQPVLLVACRDITERKRVEEALSERHKELNCLYSISALLELSGISLDELLQKIVLLLPPAWQFPGITEACIVLDGQTFRTARFRETPWMLSREIIVHGNPVGQVEVCCLEEREAGDEDPFLKEEQKLLNIIAERLGKIVERKRAEEALLKNTEELHASNEELTATEEELRQTIDELGRSELAMRESEEKYRKAFFTSPNSICITRLHDGMFISINKGFTEISGYTEEDVIGKTSLEINIWKDPEDRRKIVEGLKANGEVRNYEARFLTKTGEIYGSMSTSIIELNGVPHILNITHDITERKVAEEALKKYSGKLEETVSERTKELREAQEQLVKGEKLAVLGKLSGGVGHELRNPLGAIKNVAYFLNMALENPDEDVKEMLDILNKEVARSEEIISSLLDFARPKVPVLVNVDVSHVITETLKRFPVPHNITLVNNMSSTLPEIPADFNQLLQLFSNLVTNACQAMPEGGTLTFTSDEHKPGWVVLSVADTGVGISDKNMKKLFEPLFTTKAKGIGLGLVVVKTIIEAHGGRIEVKSKAGKGAVFTVRLPIHGTDGGVK